MHISDFHAEMTKDVNEFYIMWCKKHREEGGEQWPEEMDEGEWHEQFMAWLETREGD